MSGKAIRLLAMLFCFQAASALADAVVVDDLGNVDRTANGFWNVALHAGVTVDECASASIGEFDSGGRISDGWSLGADLETRWYTWNPSAAIPFNSMKPSFVLIVR